MKRLGFCAVALLALTSSPTRSPLAAPGRAALPRASPVRHDHDPSILPLPAHAPSPRPSSAPQVFEDYCFECHGAKDPKGHLSIERLVADTARASVGTNWQDWERIADMLESGKMPPKEATLFPTDTERTAASAWIRSSLSKYEAEHAGDPGRVTVRRLTSAEYAYAIRDLTGIDIKVAIDSSTDSVGGEGFANYGDVQFVQDASVERYLEAAKLVADHAVIGAGPLEFYADAGKTGLELSALNRINELYAAKGFRVVSGEGGRPFGLERYGKALYVAWHYKHRAALRDPAATLRGLAAKEGITGRFAEHIWAVVNRPTTRVSDAHDSRRMGKAAGADLRRRRIDRQGARRLRRALQVADHLAELVLRARRSRGRRRRRRKPAGLRRHQRSGSNPRTTTSIRSGRAPAADAAHPRPPRAAPRRCTSPSRA